MASLLIGFCPLSLVLSSIEEALLAGVLVTALLGGRCG